MQTMSNRPFVFLLSLVGLAVLATLGCTAGNSSKTDLQQSQRRADQERQRHADQEARKNDSLLGHAALEGNAAAVQTLLAQGADVDNTILKLTPLMFASLRGHTAIVRRLLAAGADPDQTTFFSMDMTALMFACNEGHATIVQIMLAKGAGVNHQAGYNATIDMSGLGPRILLAIDRGSTALYLASKNGHATVVKLLLTAQADVNPPGDLLEHTPLSIARRNGHTDIVKLLRESGARE